LIFPSLQGCRALAPELARAGLPEIAVHPAVRARVADMMKKLLDEKEGAARVRRAIVLTAPPSADANEITDKGYLNQRQVLARRADAVEALYAPARRPEIVEV
jgi:feruloyl-CoA synthase